MKINSIRFKNTLFYSGILLLILVVYNLSLYLVLNKILVKNIDDELKIKAGEISNILKAYEELNDMSSKSHTLLENLLKGSFKSKNKLIIDDLWRMEYRTLNLKNNYILIYDIKNRLIFQSNNIKKDLAATLRQTLRYRNKTYTVKSTPKPLRVINYTTLYKNKLTLFIQIATPLTTTYDFLDKLRLYIIISSIILLIMTSFIGSMLAKRILKPVMDVTKTADTITHKDLSVRITPKELDFEMQRLIESFNSMIDRLEKSFNHINEFSSNVAHELKTPLAIIRGELELAIDRLSEDNENRRIMVECLEEIDRIIKIIKDLLFMAMLAHQPKIINFAKIEVTHFLNELYEHSIILASKKNITVKLKTQKKELFINGDLVHLRRLFLNIVTNAIKYTKENGQIDITTDTTPSHITIRITDNGIGISKSNLTKIFDKFYRIDNTDNSLQSGNGLGLSIAWEIAKIHNGKIDVISNIHEGTTFTVQLPLSTK